MEIAHVEFQAIHQHALKITPSRDVPLDAYTLSHIPLNNQPIKKGKPFKRYA